MKKIFLYLLILLMIWIFSLVGCKAGAADEEAFKETGEEAEEETILENNEAVSSEYEWFQVGNVLPLISIQSKQSNELEDNRIGQMASLKADINTDQDVDGFIYQNIDMGFKRARLTIDWFDLGEVDWNREEYSAFYINPLDDEVISGLVDNGIKITYTLVFWDPESPGQEEQEGYSRFETEGEIQRYLDYTRFIVSNFKDRIMYYEILNEPITGSGTQQSVEVDDYINLVKRVIPVIKEEDPESKVVAGSIPNLYNEGDYNYLINILNSEITPFIDGISFHPMHGVSPDYELKEYYYNYPSIIQEIKNIAYANGFQGEYFADELIWRNPEIALESEPWVYSKTIAAKYFARGIVTNLGMDLNTGLALESIEEQPLMVRAIQNLCTIMAGARPISMQIEIKSKETNIKNYNFSLSNGDILITLWTDGIAVDEDSGVNADVTLNNLTSQDVFGIDILQGQKQSIMTSSDDDNLVIQDLIIRDYPIIIYMTEPF